MLVQNYHHCLLAAGHCPADQYMISTVLFLLFDVIARPIYRNLQRFLPLTALLTSVGIPHRTIQMEPNKNLMLK